MNQLYYILIIYTVEHHYSTSSSTPTDFFLLTPIPETVTKRFVFSTRANPIKFYLTVSNEIVDSPKSFFKIG